MPAIGAAFFYKDQGTRALPGGLTTTVKSEYNTSQSLSTDIFIV
jgi:hypothetical protein